MAIRGERFHIDLSSDEEEVQVDRGPSNLLPRVNLGLIGDVKERSLSATPNPPTPPTNRSALAGFPAHKKRARISAFKQQRVPPGPNLSTEKGDQDGPATTISSATFPDEALQAASTAKPSSSHASAVSDMERHSIDEENKQRLAQMSDDEIEKERQELMAGLSPSLIERLLGNINTIGEDMRHESAEQKQGGRKIPLMPTHVPYPSSKPPATARTDEPDPQLSDTAIPPISPPIDLHPASSPSGDRSTALPPPPAIHFPQPTAPPDLDPSDPSFLSNLHQKYFPTLPSHPRTRLQTKTPHTLHSKEVSRPPASASISAVTCSRPERRGRSPSPRVCTTTVRRRKRPGIPYLNWRGWRGAGSQRRDRSPFRRWGGFYISSEKGYSGTREVSW